MHSRLQCVVKSHITLLFFCAYFVICDQVNAKIADFENQNNALHFNHLVSNDVASLGGVYAFAQDAQGLIWIGGRNGLLRYNGYEFEPFKHNPVIEHTISNNYVYAILTDSQSRIWVATANGLNKFDLDTYKFTSYFHQPNHPGSLSANAIPAMLEDSQGNLWFGTYNGGLNILKHRQHDFTHMISDSSQTNTLSENTILALAEDSHGNIWIGTSQSGLNVYKPKTKTFEYYRHSPSNDKSLSSDRISVIYVDSQGEIWIGTTQGGLNRFDQQSKQFHRYPLDPEQSIGPEAKEIKAIIEDSDNKLWVASYGLERGKISVLNKKNQTFTHYYHDKNNPSSLSGREISSIFKDNNGSMWIGGYPGFVDKFNPNTPRFTNLRHDRTNTESLSSSTIMSVVEDSKENLWIGTNEGLDYLNRQTGKFTHYTHVPEKPGSLRANYVTALLEDRVGNLWVGTWGGGLSQLDRKNGTFIHNSTPIEDGGLAGTKVWSIYESRDGGIWIGTQEGGLYSYQHNTDTFTRYTTNPNDAQSLPHILVWTLLEDSRGNLWVGTHGGLSVMNRKNGTFKNFTHIPSNDKSISSNSIRALAEDNDKYLWIGTDSGLNRFNYETEEFEVFHVHNGLPDGNITSILPINHSIWISTQKGISRYDKLQKRFYNYDKRHGLASNAYSENVSLLTRKGEVIFGGDEGLTIFNPQNITSNLTVPPIVITDFQLANKYVPIGTENSPLTKHITNTTSITLDHTQSVFSFSYAALNYFIPEKNLYAYKLHGFDTHWNHVATRRVASYTNLNAGNYVFQVRGSNGDGTWNNIGTSINITIMPPPWKTWWAYSLYIIGLCFLVTVIVAYLYSKHAYEREHRLNEHLKKMDAIKDEFLASTSHELRTPLNGMIGIANSIVDGAAGPITDKVKSNLEIISSSGLRLAKLINDILDFSKLKNHDIELNKKIVNIHTVTDVIITLTKPLAEQKQLTIRNSIPKTPPLIYADDHRIQQVLYNLIGNAIKFTDHGEINISALEIGNFLEISVSDTGIGIAQMDIAKVFQSYEQFSTSRGGTGLGLAISKKLIALHDGDISIESKLGSGTTVRFLLPLPDNAIELPLKQDEYVSKNTKTTPSALKDIDNKEQSIQQSEAITTSTVAESAKYKHRILIVDDDSVNRLVVKNYLELKHYHTIEASSGESALELIANDTNIDLILLDIMMPGMSGFETCKKIRTIHNAKQLPIIFLTGKSEQTDLSTGSDVGGNDYLSKPVSKNELLARVETHIKLTNIDLTILNSTE